MKEKIRYAGFWLRFLAFLIDYIILFPIFMISSFFLGMVLASFGLFPKGFAEDLIITLLIFTIAFIYFSLMESSRLQATLGKNAIAIKVTDMEGNKISLRRSAKRFFSKIISCLIFGIGLFMIAFTENKQGLHDKISGCIVIKK